MSAMEESTGSATTLTIEDCKICDQWKKVFYPVPNQPPPMIRTTRGLTVGQCLEQLFIESHMNGHTDTEYWKCVEFLTREHATQRFKNYCASFCSEEQSNA